MSERNPGSPAGHWLRPRNGFPAITSGWFGPRSWLTKKAFVLVWAGGAMHGRGTLHRGVDRQIADVVVIELERELALERQGVEPARGGEGPFDHLVANAVVQRIEEPDILAGVGDLGGDPVEGSRLAAEIWPIIDDR